MSKRSQHVGQCCFYGNTEGSLGLIFTQNSLLNCNVVTFVSPLWRSMNADDGKCIAFAFVLCHFENTPSHINKNREFEQRGRECQRECYKTIDLITEYNNFMWECNHLVHRSPENKRNVGICWAKRLTGFKLDATYANIMQHSPTWCITNATCCANMLAQHVAFVCTGLYKSKKISSSQSSENDTDPWLEIIIIIIILNNNNNIFFIYFFK